MSYREAICEYQTETGLFTRSRRRDIICTSRRIQRDLAEQVQVRVKRLGYDGVTQFVTDH